ncbi:hypothetical protein Ae201684P_010616 [Aphanomyces euteiches]|nr:hypothetical protein Ae201684P_010616 [Aphanomyces euteiches]
MASMRPAAGLSKKNAEPFGKKKLGRNVDAFIAREDQINTALRNTKISDHIKARAVWEDKQGKRGMSSMRQRTEKQKLRWRIANSWQFESNGSKLTLTAYSCCRWERELNARGLALVRERD